MMYKKLILIFIVLLSISTYAQDYSFEKVDSLMQIEKRPIIIFLHTDWCRYCKMMEKTTLNTAEVKHILENDFYFIKFNPEVKQDITFNGNTFKYIPSGQNTGMNELASQIGVVEGKISYPTICVLNSKYEIVFQMNSYQSYEEFLVILKKIRQHVR